MKTLQLPSPHSYAPFKLLNREGEGSHYGEISFSEVRCEETVHKPLETNGEAKSLKMIEICVYFRFKFRLVLMQNVY